MHSMTGKAEVTDSIFHHTDLLFAISDCLAGTLLGTCIWYGHMLLSPHMESFLQKEGSTGETARSYEGKKDGSDKLP
jgi:hypothetical protein